MLCHKRAASEGQKAEPCVSEPMVSVRHLTVKYGPVSPNGYFNYFLEPANQYGISFCNTRVGCGKQSIQQSALLSKYTFAQRSTGYN